MPLLSYGVGRVDFGSLARGHAVGLWLGAILMVELLVVEAVVCLIVVAVV